MRDTDFDVIIAAYLIPDLARQDFDALVELVADNQLKVEASPLSASTPTATSPMDETGDHLGRKGLKIGAGDGLSVCPLAHPLLATVVVGGATGAFGGKFAKHKPNTKWKADSARNSAPHYPQVYGWHHRDLRPDQGRHRGEDLANAAISVAKVDGAGAKRLKAALAEARAGTGGG